MHFDGDSPHESPGRNRFATAILIFPLVAIFLILIFIGAKEIVEGASSAQTYDIIEGSCVASLGLFPLLAAIVFWRVARRNQRDEDLALGLALIWVAQMFMPLMILPVMDAKRFDFNNDGFQPYCAEHVFFSMVSVIVFFWGSYYVVEWIRHRNEAPNEWKR